MVPLAGPGFIREPFFSSSWEEFDAERGRRLESCGGGFWDQVGGEFKVDTKQYNGQVERDMKEFEAELSQSSASTFLILNWLRSAQITTFGILFIENGNYKVYDRIQHCTDHACSLCCLFALDSGVGRRGWRG